MLTKIKKYIFKPHLVISIVIMKIKNLISLTRIIFTTYIKGINLRIGKNIKLLQRTIISGEGSVIIGDNCGFGFNRGGYYYKGACELQPRYKDSRIIIGNNVHVNNNLFICSALEVIIGDNTLIGEGVMIIDHDAHGVHPNERGTSIGKLKTINIGNNVWIGSRVTILPGTKIGNNSIVGAGAVVKGEFSENVIIAGNPARLVKDIKM